MSQNNDSVEVKELTVFDESAPPASEPDTAAEKQLLKRIRANRIVDINTVRLFFAVLFAASILSLIPAMRPSYSDAEKRELTKFPKLTLNALATGSFFDDVNLWFADTFPFRDFLVELNGNINDLFGRTTVQIHGEVEQGDDIPDVSEPSDEDTSAKPSDTTQETESATESKPEEKPPVASEQASSSSAPSVSSVPQGPIVEQLAAILLVDNAAYEYYNFDRATADLYTSYISRAADMLQGRANVYDMIVPTSMGITAPADIAAGANTSDQRKAIDYMHSRLSPNVKRVSIFDTLMAHKNEYIYFRTDHHWTGLGAYYAYEQLMAAKGTAPTPLSSFIPRQFDGYLGSFYAASGKKPQLAATPDSVIAYQPPSGNICTVYKKDGTIKRDAPIIMDGNTLSQGSKYLSFIGGDNPLTVMENPNVAGGVCLVVKESFGNALAPLLTQNYRVVYVLDYRYFNERDPRRLNQLVTEIGANDVVFINNISATRSKSLVNAIGSFVG